MSPLMKMPTQLIAATQTVTGTPTQLKKMPKVKQQLIMIVGSIMMKR